MRPEWSFAMVGPVVKVDPNLLPHFPNLYWLGGRDYQVLPNYCRAFDVNMMCFAINAATQYINPTKALEYLATGKPVISTPVKDVVRQYSDTGRDREDRRGVRRRGRAAHANIPTSDRIAARHREGQAKQLGEHRGDDAGPDQGSDQRRPTADRERKIDAVDRSRKLAYQYPADARIVSERCSDVDIAGVMQSEPSSRRTCDCSDHRN